MAYQLLFVLLMACLCSCHEEEFCFRHTASSNTQSQPLQVTTGRPGKQGPEGPQGRSGVKGQKGETGACVCNDVELLSSKIHSMQADFQMKISQLEKKVMHCPLGMEDRRITDSQITSSSFWNNHLSHTANKARLNMNTHGWVATPGDYVGGWIQVDLLTPQEITGVVTQGRGPSSRADQWVKTYEILYGNDQTSLSVLSNWGGVKNIVFQGNTDRYNKVTNFFPEPITARYIRIRVLSYNNDPLLRFELLGC